MLHIKFGTVVVPIVIYSDNSRKPLQQRWTRYELGFAGHKFLDFRFLAVHPASMPVREYLKSHNPAQLALAARMNWATRTWSAITNVTRVKPGDDVALCDS